MNRNKRGRRKVTKPPKPTRDYAALKSELTASSHLSSECATEVAVTALVDCMRHLDELRQRAIEGTIMAEERKLIPTLSSSSRRWLAVLGLDKLKVEKLAAFD